MHDYYNDPPDDPEIACCPKGCDGEQMLVSTGHGRNEWNCPDCDQVWIEVDPYYNTGPDEDGVTITLDEREFMQAAFCGVQRYAQFDPARNNPTRQSGESMLANNVTGAVFEYVLAKYTGLFYPGCGERGASDVGREEVRGTYRDDGELVYNTGGEKADRRYWLITGQFRTYTVRGWLLGRDCVRPEWLGKQPRGNEAYAVPQSALRSPESGLTLIRIGIGEGTYAR